MAYAWSTLSNFFFFRSWTPVKWPSVSRTSIGRFYLSRKEFFVIQKEYLNFRETGINIYESCINDTLNMYGAYTVIPDIYEIYLFVRVDFNDRNFRHH